MAKKQNPAPDFDPEYGTPDEENPEWTEADFANARPAMEVFAEMGLTPPAVGEGKRRGRPPVTNKRERHNVTLDKDLVQTIKAKGFKLSTFLNDSARAAVEKLAE